MKRRYGFAVAAAFLVLVCCVLPVSAQAPVQQPGLGSAMSAMSIAQGGGIRLLGMGGVCTAVVDEGNIRNAASLVWVDRPTVDYGTVSGGMVDQGSGAEYTVRAHSIGQIAPGKLAFQFRRTALTGSETVTPSLGVEVERSTEYSAVLVAVGAGVGPKTSVGLTGALSRVHLDAVMTPPGVPAARVRGKGRGGVEAGVFHWLSSKLSVGAVYSYWDEVERTDQFVPTPATVEATYRTTIIKGGLAYRPDGKTVVAGEWARLSYENRTAGWEVTDSRPYWGIERAMTDALRLRAGAYGGALTLGAGWSSGAMRVDYCFGKDLNEKSAEDMFPGLGDQPGSDTHYVSATIGF